MTRIAKPHYKWSYQLGVWAMEPIWRFNGWHLPSGWRQYVA